MVRSKENLWQIPTFDKLKMKEPLKTEYRCNFFYTIIASPTLY